MSLPASLSRAFLQSCPCSPTLGVPPTVACAAVCARWARSHSCPVTIHSWSWDHCVLFLRWRAFRCRVSNERADTQGGASRGRTTRRRSADVCLAACSPALLLLCVCPCLLFFSRVASSRRVQRRILLNPVSAQRNNHEGRNAGTAQDRTDRPTFASDPPLLCWPPVCTIPALDSIALYSSLDDPMQHDGGCSAIRAPLRRRCCFAPFAFPPSVLPAIRSNAC